MSVNSTALSGSIATEFVMTHTQPLFGPLTKLSLLGAAFILISTPGSYGSGGKVPKRISVINPANSSYNMGTKLITIGNNQRTEAVNMGRQSRGIVKKAYGASTSFQGSLPRPMDHYDAEHDVERLTRSPKYLGSNSATSVTFKGKLPRKPLI